MPVATDELWTKMLSGEIAAHVYSSEAKGDFEPVAISASEFFTAEQSGRDEDGEPDPILKPYQIMWRDRDHRRAPATRRAIPVPHWVYMLSAAQVAAVGCASELPRRRASKEEIRAELRAVYAAAEAPPNIKRAPKDVQPRLHERGLEASERYIAKIADEAEFKTQRRKPGKTIASDRAK